MRGLQKKAGDLTDDDIMPCDAQGLEEEVVATVALDVLRGLEYMHAHSMIHRDVKVRIPVVPWFWWFLNIFVCRVLWVMPF